MATPPSAHDTRRHAARSAIVALAIASMQTFGSLPIMAHGWDAAPAMAGAAMHPMLRPALLLSTLVVMWLGRSVFIGAWVALRRRTADTNAVGALGSGAAFLYSAAVILCPSFFAVDAGPPAVHFDAASFILAFMLLGRTLDGRVPEQRLDDRVAALLAPAIVAVATASAMAWAVFGPEPRLAHALTTFVAVVVVATPCALGLAAPTSIAAAVGRAAELGVLVRSSDALERAARVDTVVIDTIGTLTEGEPELVELVLLSRASADSAEANAILRLAAALERGSSHPVGRAILAEAVAREIDVPEASGLPASDHAGTRADVEGHDVRVGAMTWLTREGIAAPAAVAGTGDATPPEAAVGIAVDGVLCAYGLVADRLRDDAHAAVARLRALGVRVIVWTGDRQDVARAVATELGADEVEAELSSAGKVATVDRLAREGRSVAICGGGVADAPAFARALVGVVLRSAAGGPTASSDIALLTGELTRLPDTLQLARRSMRVVRQNLALALAYNIALVPIAAGAFVPCLGLRVPPTLAFIAMALSSGSVLLSSRRLRRFEPKRSTIEARC